MLDTGMMTPLNRFEKRLAHQIVRAEYPHLQTFSTTDYVKVEAKDKVAEVKEQEQLKRRLDRTMSNNIGFRWLTDALAGEDLSGLDLHAIPLEIKGEKMYNNTETFNARLSEIRQVLLNSPKVLVGHNCFMDLVFIHRYFYGPLPDTVEEFQESLHTMFPTVIDTKFLSTSGPDAHIFRSSQLWQIEEALSADDKPRFGEHCEPDNTAG
jgi:poly(A)-specific ribonuclease